jgi:hypothetical protein
MAMMTPTRIPSAIAAHVDMSTTMPQFRFSAWFRHAAGTGVASGVLAVGRTTVTPRGKITGPGAGRLTWRVRGVNHADREHGLASERMAPESRVTTANAPAQRRALTGSERGSAHRLASGLLLVGEEAGGAGGCARARPIVPSALRMSGVVAGVRQ